MSGCGRKSQYRKHLTDSVLNDLPEPEENEGIARVVSTRGSNQFEIVFAESLGTPQVALLPNKFHKLVWLKRGDFVIVSVAGGQGTDGGIRNIIEHILYKEQIKHLQLKKLWPIEFGNTMKDDIKDAEPRKEDDGIVYEHILEDDLVPNINRINRLQIADESESDSDDGDEEEQED